MASIILKVEHYKISELLNDSVVSKMWVKNWIEVNDLSSGQYYFNKNIRFNAYQKLIIHL